MCIAGAVKRFWITLFQISR